jgi:hypothetical protein
VSYATDPYYAGGTQITLRPLGASVFPTKIVAPDGCMTMQFKVLSGSTVQILPNQVSGITIAGATSLAAIGGYPMTTTDMYPFYGPISFYMASAGATAVVAANLLFSASGTTLI